MEYEQQKIHDALKNRDHTHEVAESEAMFLSIGDGAIVTDSAGRIIRVNQAALDILGYQADDMLYKWYPGFVEAVNDDGTIVAKMDRPITQVFMYGKPISTRINYKKKNGEIFTAYITVSPVMLKGKPIGAVEVFRDITDEVTLEKAKDEFISLASHQLRTPATAVKQYAGMLLEGFMGDLSPDQKTMIQKVYDNNERQIHTINSLLRIAQVDAGQIELNLTPVNLSVLLKSVIDDQAHKFKSLSQAVHLKIPKKEVVVDIDEPRFRMVLENLLDNASKYSPKGKDIYVNLKLQKNKVVIEIKDTGVGIAPHDIPRIFEKFSRIDNPLSVLVGGTGLGLYWVDKIVQLHGAKLRVKSEINKGTAFCIQIDSKSKSKKE